jgi:hypothetical protein
MSRDSKGPFILEIISHEKIPAHFRWVIKDDGKLVRVSGGAFPSKRKARANGMDALEKEFEARLKPH